MSASSRATFTVTGTNGPGLDVTALVIEDVLSWSVDVTTGILSLNLASGQVEQFDISDAATFTVTISSGNYTVTIS